MNLDAVVGGAWYIDAIDARAGLAFAMHRLAQRDDAEAFVDGPGVFIEPPDFVPEVVASRTLALAMAQRYGQAGVYLGGQEVAFDSLAAIVEFVRRAYLRGSAGDGGGENGVVPPIAPDGGGEGDDFTLPALRTGPREGNGYVADPGTGVTIDAVAAWVGYAEGLGYRSRAPVGAVSRPVAPPSFATSTLASETTIQRLGRGAVAALHALYRTRIDRHDDERTLHWADALRRYLQLTTRLGLWPTMRAAFPEDVDPVSSLHLPVHSPAVTEIEADFFWMMRNDDWHSGLHRWWGFAYEDVDAFEALALLPVPSRLAPPSIEANLQALLTAAVATPTSMIGGDPATFEPRIELVLFAAACLNARDPWSPTPGTHPRGLAPLLAARLARRTLAWLAANMPEAVYAPDVEGLVESASSMPA